MRSNLPVTNREVHLSDASNILSTTKPDSRITYVNSDFIQISGFTEQELLGQPHNMVRHPDMPEAAFQHMWSTIKAGNSWMGLVKNRCKNGDHYWVSAYVTPIAKNGEITEIQSVRTKASPEAISRAEQSYAELKSGKAAPTKARFSIRTKLLLWAAFALTLGQAGSFALNGFWLQLISSVVLPLVLIAATVSYWLSPLKKLQAMAKSIADNPLSQKLYTNRMDELGDIEFALRMLQAETGAVVGRINDASDKLTRHTRSSLQQVMAGNKASAAQQSETDQMAAAVTQMAASIQQVVTSAQVAANAAEEADQETSQGEHLVEITRSSIKQLELELGKATQVIHELEKQSIEISGVLEVIQGVAEQTNLLALNAAIEAARAGEQGRGFAVVADEVRSLAGRTQQSTADIQQMIDGLQLRTRTAVTAMTQSSTQANGCVGDAEKAALALRSIGRKVNEISEMNVQIAAAAEQQGVMSNNIHRGVNCIRDAANDNVVFGQNNHTSVSAVAHLSDDLNEISRQFWSKRKR
ncbi:methyl-accepting chemotaxis protein [Alkalimonas amylolytica]|uniref:Methyl-accepting chemotaxis sensory transducer with Pas/Pac sensor n=1 Tax=Alkalimonas amylolytica TaxID=152573 RepID=A0A1H3Y4Q1_ALKAM|nr:PAS domain-containing methyl-accepting chemotaxis protein [Alkalimonas amylolytica]SEA06520.1 methyl-accepting chemotaxis sensory transducer with Pas/Pac sensor [Alkalimonas amylolytica]